MHALRPLDGLYLLALVCALVVGGAGHLLLAVPVAGGLAAPL